MPRRSARLPRARPRRPKVQPKFFLLRFGPVSGDVAIELNSVRAKLPLNVVGNVLAELAREEPNACYVAIPLDFYAQVYNFLCKKVKGEEFPN